MQYQSPETATHDSIEAAIDSAFTAVGFTLVPEYHSPAYRAPKFSVTEAYQRALDQGLSVTQVARIFNTTEQVIHSGLYLVNHKESS